MSQNQEVGTGLKNLFWSVLTVFFAFFLKDYLFKATWKTATGSSSQSFISTLFYVVDDDCNRRQMFKTPSENASNNLEILKKTPLLD